MPSDGHRRPPGGALPPRDGPHATHVAARRTAGSRGAPWQLPGWQGTIGHMSMNAMNRAPKVPTPPQGEQIASYATYLEAQRAVDHLSDKEFPVQHVTIVGTDLAMVERVTGRLTYSRVALAGAASGMWFGLFVGLLLSLFSSSGSAVPIFAAVAIGAAFGILFSVISFSMTGGKRDFTSASQIVAGTYAVLCDGEVAQQARGLLQSEGGPGLGRPARNVQAPIPARPPTQPFGTAPSQPFGTAPSQPSPPAHGSPAPGQSPPAPVQPPHQPPAGPIS